MNLIRKECHDVWNESVLTPGTRIMYDRMPKCYGIVENCVGKMMFAKWFSLENGAFMFTHFLVVGDDEDKVEIIAN